MDKIELIIFIYLPEILVCVGVLFIIQRILFIKNATKTIGEISEVQKFQVAQSRGSSLPNAQRTVYYPDVHFEDESGRRYVCIPAFGRQFLSIRVGDQVPILYKESNPKKSLVNYWIFVWVPPIAILLIGIASVYLKYK